MTLGGEPMDLRVNLCLNKKKQQKLGVRRYRGRPGWNLIS